MPKSAKIFIAVTATLGFCLFAESLTHWQSHDYLHLLAFLVLALLASGLKVVLPGINTSMSPNFLFILLGVLELSQGETMLLGCASTAVQCFWKMNRPARPVRVLFNVFSMMAPTVWICCLVYRHTAALFGNSLPLMVLATGTSYFLVNTLPIAAIICLTEKRDFRETWSQCYFWSFPYYLAGAGLVALVHYVNRLIGWQTSLLVMPVVYWVYRSYRLYLAHLEDEKRHVSEMAELHLRTIEALALAIDAKDHTTHEHLQRVRIYATEIGRDLRLPLDLLEALRAASILHDIGKLAVPEHIISKPGKLTPEEFEKMKIHPAVGAEILQRVKFPYPVVPIVRHHHEKWDGTGYPDGLVGEAIPIGARILSAVDCMDALASDRQYRRALPLEKALEYVVSLAGKEFDPKVVEILQRRYLELEQLALAASSSSSEEIATAAAPLPSEIAATPAAGFEQDAPPRPVIAERDFLNSIAAARHEAQMLFELSHDLGNSLSLEDTLSVVSARLRRLIPYDSIAIWILENEVLIPKHVSGDDFRLFSSLEIPIGQGLSGWVVHNRKPILNGNPSVEPGYLNSPAKFSTLRAALSVPLEGITGTVGALSLYRSEADSFNRDHLRIVLAISPKIAMSIENALKYQQAQTSATTDYLTGLPNARSLFLQLDRELARCKRTGATLAVMVCDLDRFKGINDVFGHLEGNKVLHAFAQALRESSREYEYVARMGGDEFVIIVPGLTPEQAKYKAERISELARQTGFSICGKNTLSASVGTAFFLTDGTDAEHLLAQADRRMYLMKGLNRHDADESQFPPSRVTLVQ
jgi:diguanylate cyclase (GGDEF)-like protein/putative nucleotidyltransferase with HDIG domain